MGIDPLALDTVVFARGLRTLNGARPPLAGIDLDILPGEIFVIVGRAGSGKAALLESLVGLHPVSADLLTVCGSDPRRFGPAVRQQIGVAPRRAAVERHLGVAEALELFGAFYQRRSSTDSLLGLLDLASLKHRPVDALPADAAQRFRLALALINDPLVLFADEPTRDLDPESARRVWDLLRLRREQGRTSVITTDHLEEAERLADRIAILDAGRLVAVDSPARLMARSASPVRVIFDLPRPPLDLEALAALGGVTGPVIKRDDTYTLSSHDGFATMRALIRLLDQQQASPRSLAMHRPTLEDVFFELTGEAHS